MSYQLTWNAGAYDLTEEASAIPTITDDTEIPTERVPRRHGLYVSETPTRGARTIRVHGSIFKSTAAAAVAQLDSLLKQLNLGQKQLRFNSSRYINCYKRGFTWTFIGPTLTAIAYEIEFLAADPFFYAVSQTSTPQAVTYNPTAWAHSNPGDELVYPVITIAPSGSNVVGFTLTNSTTGKSLTYAGTVVVGQTLVIDCANFTVMNNGVDDIGNFSGTFLWLESGSNSLSMASTNCTVTIAYNARYNAPDWS